MGAITRKITRYGIELDDLYYYDPGMACYVGLLMEIDFPEDCETMPTFMQGRVCDEVFSMQMCVPGEVTYLRSHGIMHFTPTIRSGRPGRI